VSEPFFISAARRFRSAGVIAMAAMSLVTIGWVATAALPIKITNDVATPADLEAEVQSLLKSIEPLMVSAESYRDGQEQLKRQSVQIAILAQALAQHESDSPLKPAAESLRNAALGLSRASNSDEAGRLFAAIQSAAEGKTVATDAASEPPKIASASSMMHAMKQRAETIRKSFRKPKDPEVESRHAMMIALMSLCVHDDSRAVKNPDVLPQWKAASLEVQQHMSRAAIAIKTRHESAANEFRLGMEACDKCHLQFKP
jgi:hypothetical protein